MCSMLTIKYIGFSYSIFHSIIYQKKRKNVFGMVEVFYLLVPGVVLAHQRNPPHGERRRPLHCPQPKISNRSKDYWKFSAQFWWKAYYCVKSKHLQNMLLRGQSSSQYEVTKCSPSINHKRSPSCHKLVKS